MPARYPGLRTVARRYWRAYTTAVVSTALVVAFAGAFAAFVVAAYYPVVDLVFTRRGLPSPGAVLFTVTVYAAAGLFDVSESIPDRVPVITPAH